MRELREIAVGGTRNRLPTFSRDSPALLEFPGNSAALGRPTRDFGGSRAVFSTHVQPAASIALDQNGHGVHTDSHEPTGNRICAGGPGLRDRAMISLSTLLPSVDRVRVLVADPDPLARRALIDSLREDGAFTVIGQATDGVEAVELARHYAPDVVLLATYLPGARRDRRLRADRRRARADARRDARDGSGRRARDARGARREPAASSSRADEVDAISRALSIVSAGHAIISPELTGVLVERLRRTPGGRQRHPAGQEHAHRSRVGGARPDLRRRHARAISPTRCSSRRRP